MSMKSSTANLQQVDLVGEDRAESQFSFYTITADDYLINGQSVHDLSPSMNSTLGAGFPVIIDSGLSTNVLPPSLVDVFYSAFITAPQLVDIQGSSMLASACDVEVPSFGIQIGSQVFNMTAQTILDASMNTTVNGTVFCGLGIQPGVETAGVLGDPFLSNVVAVFDIGRSEMHFAQRAADSSTGGQGSNSRDTSKGSPSNDPANKQARPPCHANRPKQHRA